MVENFPFIFKLLIFLPFIIKGQDSLFFHDGTTGCGKITEISQDTVTYQNSGQYQNFIKIPSIQIKLIKYKNGDLDSNSFKKKTSSVIIQEKANNNYQNDIYFKKHCSISFNSSCGGFSDGPDNLYLSLFFNPKFGFFITNRLNIVIGYLGIRNSSSMYPKDNGYYNNVEIISNYFFAVRKVNSFHALFGFIYGQLPDPSYIREFGLSPKIGGGTNWRFKRHKNVSLSLNTFVYIPLIKTPPGQMPIIPTWDFGINYFLKPKSNIKTP